ncbi:MAG: radical SAM protein [Coriobacteriales bacterium]|nr:radical SAM protein [Coriobacteriales bacterium]
MRDPSSESAALPAYARLADKYGLRGWELLPYALIDFDKGSSTFLDRPDFEALAACNGLSDLARQGLSKKQQQVIASGIAKGLIEPLEQPRAIAEAQRYRKAHCRYIQAAEWSITGYCNLKCKHCYISAPQGVHGELPFEKMQEIIDQLSAANVGEVMLSGGEPLVRKDFWQIVDALREKRIAVTTIGTNALLVTDQFLAQCEKRGIIWDFNISFDGVGFHDWLRGVDGVEAKTIEAIRRIQRAGHRVSINTALHRESLVSLMPTYRLLRSLGVDGWKTSAIANTGNWTEVDDKRTLQDAVLFEKYLEVIKQYRNDGMPFLIQLGGYYLNPPHSEQWISPHACHDGSDAVLQKPLCAGCRTAIYLSPEGKFLPCMALSGTFVEENAQSILELPLVEQLGNSKAFDLMNMRLSELHRHNAECAACEHRLECGTCRALALTEDGTYLGVDRAACAFWQLNAKERIGALLAKT